MEEEEMNYNSIGMKNGAIDKLKGTTGTVAPKTTGKVESLDQKYFEGIKKYVEDRPSQSIGGRGMQGARLKMALRTGNYAEAASAMKEIKNKFPDKFQALDKVGVSRSGFRRGGRYSENKSTYTGKLSEDMSSRVDKTFDPSTQMTSKQTYKFDD